MMFLWIFPLILIGFAIWYFGTGGKGNLLPRNKKGDSIDILKKRFAKGEIDDKEFEERKARLEEDDI